MGSGKEHRAEREGIAAYHAGRSLAANPYIGGYAERWRRGWIAGQHGATAPGVTPRVTRRLARTAGKKRELGLW